MTTEREALELLREAQACLDKSATSRDKTIRNETFDRARDIIDALLAKNAAPRPSVGEAHGTRDDDSPVVDPGAVAAHARIAGLEEAARICDQMRTTWSAAAIRAHAAKLKEGEK